MQASFRILLASGSPYRKRLLKKLIDHFEVAAPDLDESPELNEFPGNLAARLARQKAEALSSSFPNHWIIGSDQVAVRGSTRLDKPGNQPEALRQLSESSGKCVTFFTSVCLLSPGAENIRTETDICRVHFKQLSGKQISRYLCREQPFDCAASFKSEGSGIALVRKIEGNDPNALIGLPLILLTRMMEDCGLEVL
ncbi:MAG: Maf family protein [Methylococcales bacterium]